MQKETMTDSQWQLICRHTERNEHPLTLEVFEVVFVGVGEGAHGAIVELLEEAYILRSVKQPLQGGANQEHVGVALLTIVASGERLLQQQLNPCEIQTSDQITLS